MDELFLANACNDSTRESRRGSERTTRSICRTITQGRLHWPYAAYLMAGAAMYSLKQDLAPLHHSSICVGSRVRVEMLTGTESVGQLLPVIICRRRVALRVTGSRSKRRQA